MPGSGMLPGEPINGPRQVCSGRGQRCQRPPAPTVPTATSHCPMVTSDATPSPQGSFQRRRPPGPHTESPCIAYRRRPCSGALPASAIADHRAAKHIKKSGRLDREALGAGAAARNAKATRALLRGYQTARAALSGFTHLPQGTGREEGGSDVRDGETEIAPAHCHCQGQRWRSPQGLSGKGARVSGASYSSARPARCAERRSVPVRASARRGHGGLARRAPPHQSRGITARFRGHPHINTGLQRPLLGSAPRRRGPQQGLPAAHVSSGARRAGPGPQRPS